MQKEYLMTNIPLKTQGNTKDINKEKEGYPHPSGNLFCPF